MRCNSDVLDVYESLDKLGDINEVSPEETRILLKKAKNGDKKARDILVIKNLKFVMKRAKIQYNATVEFSDLFAAGIAGLIKAIDAFDISRKNTFLTFARFSIDDAISTAAKNTSKSLSITFDEYKKLRKIYGIKNRLSNKGIQNENELISSIAYELNISTKEVTRLLESSNIPVSYDVPASPGDTEDTKLSYFADEKYETPEEAAINSNIQETLYSEVNLLQKKQQFVIKLRYGLTGKKPMSCSEIGILMNCSKAWVNQIEHKALNTLKNNPILKAFFPV